MISLVFTSVASRSSVCDARRSLISAMFVASRTIDLAEMLVKTKPITYQALQTDATSLSSNSRSSSPLQDVLEADSKHIASIHTIGTHIRVPILSEPKSEAQIKTVVVAEIQEQHHVSGHELPPRTSDQVTK